MLKTEIWLDRFEISWRHLLTTPMIPQLFLPFLDSESKTQKTRTINKLFFSIEFLNIFYYYQKNYILFCLQKRWKFNNNTLLMSKKKKKFPQIFASNFACLTWIQCSSLNKTKWFSPIFFHILFTLCSIYTGTCIRLFTNGDI